MEVTAEVKTFLSETSDTLTGSAHRLFRARAVRQRDQDKAPLPVSRM